MAHAKNRALFIAGNINWRDNDGIAAVAGVCRTMLNEALLYLASFPEKFANRIRQIEYKKRSVIGVGSRVYAPGSIDNFSGIKSAITIGNHSHVYGRLVAFAHGGSVTIGDYCFIGDHSRIWSMSSIFIGNRVFVSHGVNIHDNTAHSLSAKERHQHFLQIYNGNGHQAIKMLNNVAANPIVINDDAWIGFNATVLKGVTIGRGAVVGACAVVTKDVLPYAVVVGNPARVVGEGMP
jgi:acetyltransferase-like isoleucine patch superfamily enzyme